MIYRSLQFAGASVEDRRGMGPASSACARSSSKCPDVPRPRCLDAVPTQPLPSYQWNTRFETWDSDGRHGATSPNQPILSSLGSCISSSGCFFHVHVTTTCLVSAGMVQQRQHRMTSCEPTIRRPIHTGNNALTNDANATRD